MSLLNIFNKLKNLPCLERQLETMQSQNQALENRIASLEHRLFNYYRERWNALDYFADYLVNAELPGDYAEFGVFKGTTFGYAARIFYHLFPQMRFLAFDSFEGLPEPADIDKSETGFSSGFYKGQFSCGEASFRENVAREVELPPDRLLTIPGWFDVSLTPQTAELIDLKKLDCVWIDCDFYASTVPVLNFITPFLSVGTLVIFDDWRCYHNLATHGEQRACAEWLNANPGLELNDFISFGFHGMSFTVAKLPGEK